MRVCERFVRALVLVALASSTMVVRANAEVASPPTVSVSPSDLSFGVPTPPANAPASSLTSIQQLVTFVNTGSAAVSVAATVGAGNPNQSFPGDFVITLNTCTTPVASKGNCQVGVTFTSTQATGVLETATLNFVSGGTPGTLSVPMNGALGSFEVFAALNVNNSTFSGVTWPNSPGNPVASNIVTLFCSANPTAVLSSTPDGLSNLFQDNTIQISNVTANGTQPTANACYGGDSNFQNFTGFPTGTTNCFQQSYEGLVTGFIGQNPDLATAGDGSFLSTFGVQPINLQAPPQQQYSPVLVSGTQKLTITLLDAGGFLGSSTVHLVTNCNVTGVQPGGTITGNPINPNDPASQTPQFTYDSANNQHIAFAADYTALAGTQQIAPNTIPLSFDTGITQAQFATMVNGTSAGPAVCIRLSGELAPDGTPLCKAITIECTIGTANSPAGANCPQSITSRNLLFSAAFDTPDPIKIAPFTGPGFLMGQDTWAAAGPPTPGNQAVAAPTACSFNEPGNPLATQLCPQDTLTAFLGGDPATHGTTRSTNSTFIPVLNMPLPITVPLVTSGNILGWQTGTTVKVKFLSSPAIYPIFNPLPSNGFKAAPIQSVTYGTTAAGVQVPDTTLPIATDVTLFNPGGNGGVSTCPGAPSGIFNVNTSLNSDTSTGNPLTEGRYTLHYFATDCASTEELNFTPNKNPAANWASFKTVQINIDMTAPALKITNVRYNAPAKATQAGTVTVTFNCSDPRLADGTAGSGVFFCGPFLFLGNANTGSLTATFAAAKGSSHGSIPLSAVDLAGNTFNANATY